MTSPKPSLADIEVALQASWTAETSDDPLDWTPGNPTKGQCAVSSLVVQHFFGGEVLIAPVVEGGGDNEYHCWNVLPGGETVDFTSEQFGGHFVLGDPVDLIPIVNDTGVDRSMILLDAVRQQLA